MRCVRRQGLLKTGLGLSVSTFTAMCEGMGSPVDSTRKTPRYESQPTRVRSSRAPTASCTVYKKNRWGTFTSYSKKVVLRAGKLKEESLLHLARYGPVLWKGREHVRDLVADSMHHLPKSVSDRIL